jgi:hypothetical protein
MPIWILSLQSNRRHWYNINTARSIKMFHNWFFPLHPDPDSSWQLYYHTPRISGSSVSTVSDYGLDDQNLISGRSKRFMYPLASVPRPTLRPTQPTIQWVPGDHSPGVKHGWGEMLTTHHHLVLRSRKSRSYTSSPPWCLWGIEG